MTTSADRPALRADAERNRERILATARRMFAEHGLDVPMEDVARQASVGVATLYRRFPTREDLIAAVFEAKMTAHADAVTTALTDPDSWHGFCRYLEHVCAMQAEDRGFANALTMTFPTARALEAERDRAYHGLVELISRAKVAGKLRRDFVPEDVVMLLMANAGVIAATDQAAPCTWKRLLAYLIQAFAAPATPPVTVPLPDPPAPTAMYRALLRLRGPRTGTAR
ncbi:helix-turn-helix domain-containing protein [Streptosporangium sp. NPDC051023]|uniref:TetR/AcrR family transcriptional regulator n=1 Tax=Streptosporangium sp. NPDC051023 TaxID=3155410 RepID=UPI00344C7235